MLSAVELSPVTSPLTGEWAEAELAFDFPCHSVGQVVSLHTILPRRKVLLRKRQEVLQLGRYRYNNVFIQGE